MNAGIYCRISLDSAGQGLGVQRQEAMCREKATALGWTVAEVYTDNDVSASKDKPRPEYTRLLADLEAGTIDAVVVYAVDRLTRKPVELETFIDLADRKSISLANVTGDVDLSSPMGRLTARIMGSVARAEVEKTGERLRAQKAQRAAAGLKHGGRYRVYGYDRQYKVIESEAAVVKEAFTRRAAGESSSAIAADFASRGLTTVSGNPWTSNTLIKVFAKTEYAGILTHAGKIVGKTAYESIVDEATFNAAQTAVAKSKRGTNARTHLLSGILVCSQCMTTLKGNAAGPAYRCPSKTSVPTACGACSIRLPETDEAIFNAAYRKWQDTPQVKTNTRDYQGEIDAIDVKMTQAREAFTGGGIGMDDLMPMLATLKAQRATLSAEQASQAVDYGLLAPVMDWEDMNLSQKRLWITSFVNYVLVYRPTHGARYGYDVSRLEVHYKDGTKERLSRGKVVDRRVF